MRCQLNRSLGLQSLGVFAKDSQIFSSDDPRLDRSAGVPRAHGPRRHVLGDYRTRADDRAFADRDARVDEALRTDPGPWSDGDGPRYQGVGEEGIIVRPSAEEGSLGDDRVISDGDRRKIIQINAFPD